MKTKKLIIYLFCAFVIGFSLSNIKNIFWGTINSETNLVISRLKEIKKLEVLQSEVLAYKHYQNNSYFNNNEFVVIEKAKAIYGIDFDKNFKVTINKDEIELTVSDIELFDLVINPNSIDFIGVKKGLFTNQQDFEKLKKEVSVELYDELKIASKNRDLLNKARDSAKKIISSTLLGLKFKTIKINLENTYKL